MNGFPLRHWERLSRRERFFCAAALAAMLAYAAYALTLESPVRDAIDKRARLGRLNAEYRRLLTGHRRLEGLTGRLAGLNLELEKKREEERLLLEGAASPRPVEALLRELRQTAGKMPLQLVDMDIKTGMVSKSMEFVASPPPSEFGQGKIPWAAKPVQAEKVNYTVSRIVLSYRSTYLGAVNYFLRVVDLPYGISVKTVEMVGGNGGAVAVGGMKRHIGGGGFPEGELPLNTKLGIEIFYR